jgi:type I restriction enzyme, S subunit
VIETVPFADALKDVSAGNTKIAQGEFLSSGPLAVVDQGQSLVAGFTDNLSAAVHSPAPLIFFGDHTRALKFIDFPFAMGADGVKVLQVRDGFDPKFVFRYLQSRQIPSAGYSRHFKFLKEIEVPKPPLSEQRRIAMILDHTDALRTKRRRVLAHLASLIPAVFNEMFGTEACETATLDELCTVSGEYGANVPSVEHDPALPRYVRITDIDDRGSLNHDVESPGGAPSDWERYRLQDGDLLFARSGATVGKTYRYRDSDGPAVFAGYLIRYRPDPTRVLPDYLFAVTKTAKYAAWVAARQNVVAQPNINAKQYGRELPIPVHELARQQEFVGAVNAIGLQRAIVQRGLAADIELFGSLQWRAFRGTLRSAGFDVEQ